MSKPRLGCKPRPVAYCVTYVHNGRRQQKSDRTRDLALARVPADAKIEDISPSKWQGYKWDGGEKTWITGRTEEEILSQLGRSIVLPSSAPIGDTLIVYGKQYLAQQLADRRIQASGYANEISLIDAHLVGSKIEGLALERVTRQDLQTFLNEKTLEAEASGRGRSTVVHLHALLRKICRAAALDEKMAPISFDYRSNRKAVSIDPMLADRHDDDIFTSEEIEAILGAADDVYDRAIVGLALCGLRPPGEVLGVKTSDVDYEKRELWVHGQIRCEKQPNGKWERVYKDRTKTGRLDPRRKSRVPIPERAMPYIESTRELGAEFVVPSPVDNGPMHPSTASKRWAALLERAGVRHRRFYNTRHTVATRLIRDGADPKTVQLIGGWSDARTLLNAYVRIDVEQAAKQLSMMGVLCKVTEKFDDLIAAVDAAPLEVKLKVLLHLTTNPLASS